MDAFEIIKDRRSVKKYTDKRVWAGSHLLFWRLQTKR